MGALLFFGPSTDDEQTVVVDDYGVFSTPEATGHFMDVVASGSRNKARRFLEAVAGDGHARGWELIVHSRTGVGPLNFSGRCCGARMLIAATPLRQTPAVSLHWAELQSLPVDLRGALVDLLATGEGCAAELNTNTLDPYAELARVNSELAELHRQLGQRQRELEASTRDKSLLLGMVAHDLRNPLTAVVGYVEVLRVGLMGDGISRQGVVSSLDSLRAASRHLSKLVDGMLTTSAIETGRIELHLEPFAVETMIEAVLARVQPLAEQKRVTVRSRLFPCRYPGDENRLGQAVENLTTNAIKHSPMGGAVEIAMRQQDDSLVISVTDHGEGIPLQERNKLFLPFSRGKQRGTGGQSSVGLGLYLVKQIVVGHGGQARYESELGAGTTFEISLPYLTPDS